MLPVLAQVVCLSALLVVLGLYHIILGVIAQDSRIVHLVTSASFPPRSKEVRRPDRPPLLGINVHDPGYTRST